MPLSPSRWQWPCQLCARPSEQGRDAAPSATVPTQVPAFASGNIWMPRTSLHSHLLPARLHRLGAWWPRGSQGQAPAPWGVSVSLLPPWAPSVLSTCFWLNSPPRGVLAPDPWRACSTAAQPAPRRPSACPRAPSEGDMGCLGAEPLRSGGGGPGFMHMHHASTSPLDWHTCQLLVPSLPAARQPQHSPSSPACPAHVQEVTAISEDQPCPACLCRQLARQLHHHHGTHSPSSLQAAKGGGPGHPHPTKSRLRCPRGWGHAGLMSASTRMQGGLGGSATQPVPCLGMPGCCVTLSSSPPAVPRHGCRCSRVLMAPSSIPSQGSTMCRGSEGKNQITN